MAASGDAPFPVEAGDTVSFLGENGLEAGYFQRWKRGRPLVAFVDMPDGWKGETRTVRVDAENLRPSNCARMVAQRGHLDDPQAEQRREAARMRRAAQSRR